MNISRRNLIKGSTASILILPNATKALASILDVVSLADFGCVADCVNGMTGTDNTANIQAAIAATPAGGGLYIPGNAVAGGDGPGYGFASTLTIDHPINVFGRGMYSRLVPLSGFNPATPNIHVTESDFYWGDITFRDFLIGT